MSKLKIILIGIGVALALAATGAIAVTYCLYRLTPNAAPQVAYEAAPDFTITIIDQHDADTFTFERNGTREKVRPRFIDAPELAQDDGPQALEWSKRFIEGRKVVVRFAHYDAHYGRWVGELIVFGRPYDEAIVSAGWAMLDPRYLTKAASDRLDPLQAKAKLAGKGVWRNPNPTPPWIWRANKKAIGELPE